MAYISADESIDRWKEKSLMAKAREDWQKAAGFYSSGRFDVAAQFADTARKNALAVYVAGFEEIVEVGPDYSGYVVWGAVGLVALGLLIFILRNLKKIKGAILTESPSDEWDGGSIGDPK